MAERTIVVFGATGSQGGAVADSLLKGGKFKVRAVTRNPASDKAKALADRGAELVQADFNDKASLSKAFDGAYGGFLVTDFYGAAQANADKEKQQGIDAVDAAKQAGVKHLVFSSLEDVRTYPGVTDKLPQIKSAPGRYVGHWEAKAEVEEHLKASGVPHTILHTSIFYENFLLGFMPFFKQDDGSYVFYLNVGTEKGHPANAVADIGNAAAAILNDPDKYIGKTEHVVGEHFNMDRVAASISKVTGKTLKYVDVPDEKAAAGGYPGADDLANMWAFYKYFPFFNDARPVDKAIVKGQTFEEWAADHKDELLAQFDKQQ
jgi:uncharacterized protein YbjT (DUF2867 family)